MGNPRRLSGTPTGVPELVAAREVRDVAKDERGIGAIVLEEVIEHMAPVGPDLDDVVGIRGVAVAVPGEEVIGVVHVAERGVYLREHQRWQR
jgi:hypothetical protein